MTPQRLILSSAEDWEAVYRLRAAADAIVVGGETLRRDNPSLGLKSERLVAQRVAQGREAEPMRVVISGRGEIPTDAKIFTKGEGRVVIFSQVERPELDGLCEVIVRDEINGAVVVTELERRGVMSLFVEGGAKVLNMFLASDLVDRVRVAVNPAVVVGDPAAPKFIAPKRVVQSPCKRELLGGVEVVTYDLSERGVSERDRELMARCVEYSRQSPPKDSCYRVGALIETAKGEIFEGYTLQTSPTHHAEQAAIHHALKAGAELLGATIYSSMEPCSQRSSEPESCSQLIIRYGFSRALFALYEPSHFVVCRGAENMRRAGVEVHLVPELGGEVYSINSHIFTAE